MVIHKMTWIELVRKSESDLGAIETPFQMCLDKEKEHLTEERVAIETAVESEL